MNKLKPHLPNIVLLLLGSGLYIQILSTQSSDSVTYKLALSWLVITLVFTLVTLIWKTHSIVPIFLGILQIIGMVSTASAALLVADNEDHSKLALGYLATLSIVMVMGSIFFGKLSETKLAGARIVFNVMIAILSLTILTRSTTSKTSKIVAITALSSCVVSSLLLAWFRTKEYQNRYFMICMLLLQYLVFLTLTIQTLSTTPESENPLEHKLAVSFLILIIIVSIIILVRKFRVPGKTEVPTETDETAEMAELKAELKAEKAKEINQEVYDTFKRYSSYTLKTNPNERYTLLKNTPEPCLEKVLGEIQNPDHHLITQILPSGEITLQDWEYELDPENPEKASIRLKGQERVVTSECISNLQNVDDWETKPNNFGLLKICEDGKWKPVSFPLSKLDDIKNSVCS